MNKNFLRSIGVILCSVVLCATTAACGKTEHTCVYTEYGYNGTEHWRYCPHDNNIDPDSHEAHVASGTCICGYVVPETDGHVCAYTAYGYSKINHWRYCPYDNNIDPDSYESHDDEGTCVCGYVIPTEGTVEYRFSGDEKDRAGYAEGSVTITPLGGVNANAIYELYWGNDNGILDRYYALGSGKGKGENITVSIGENIMIPRDATKIYATEGDKVIASAPILESKRYDKTPELVFASVSDVHVNYVEGADFWTNALNEYQKAGAKYIIVSGDLTSDGSNAQFAKYRDATECSKFTGLIFASIGNHEQQAAGRANFFRYAIYDGHGKNWVALDKAETYFTDDYAGSLHVSVHWSDVEGGANTYYFYAVIENNVYIFMDQMLSSTGNASNQDNFSVKQLDWAESVLLTYSGKRSSGEYRQYNLNIVEHALIANYGAGDRYNGAYSQPMRIRSGHTNIKRFVTLLEEYTEAIWMSGHTHLGFTTSVDFVDRVYGAGGTLTTKPTARSVHNSSVAQARWYSGGSIVYKESYESGSEGYIGYVYADDIVYEGVSFKEYTPGSTDWQSALQHKVFARATFIMPVLTRIR